MPKQSPWIDGDASQSRILAATVSTTIAFAVSRGVAMTEIEAVIGVAGLEIADPIARVPDDILAHIWKMLEKREPDTPLTVSMARAAPFTVFGGLAHGMQFAATLREALRLLTKNRALMADRLSLTLVEANGEAVLEGSHPSELIDKGRGGEVAMALVSRLVEEVLDIPCSITRVQFMQGPLGPVSAYEDFFKAPVLFEQVSNAIVFDGACLDDEPSQKNLELFKYVDEHYAQVLERISRNNQPSEFQKLRNTIEVCAAAGEFSAAAVAIRANTSIRSAQRLAQSHGTSLSEMILEFRISTAKDLLRQKRFDIETIASLLGYSDGRAFRRAFKRRTGLTPGQFRKSPD